MTTLLVDGDILAYRAACKSQEAVQWEEGAEPDILANRQNAFDAIECELHDYYKAIPPTSVIVCLSDSRNWRKELWSGYKAHREKVVRPVLLEECRQYLRDRGETQTYPRLEADDVMGILATSMRGAVIVSIDKDMRSIPGRLFAPNRVEDGVVRITVIDAFKHHMLQTLAGDSADGYKGCPGVGPKKAQSIIDSCKTNPYEHFNEWRKELWSNILHAFLERNLSEADALLQARLSNILTKGRYVSETARVRLWQPPE